MGGKKVREKEEAILEAAEKLRGKFLTPWAQGIFDINYDAVRTCRIGNGRVVPVLKEELIQLPADAEIEEDDMLFPPVCLARLNRGRNGVAAAPQGRPRRNRIVRVRRCGNCNQPGHKRSKCRFNSVWFDWNDENDYPFQEVYRRSIPGAQ